MTKQMRVVTFCLEEEDLPHNSDWTLDNAPLGLVVRCGALIEDRILTRDVVTLEPEQ